MLLSEEIIVRPAVDSLSFKCPVPEGFFDQARFEGLREIAVECSWGHGTLNDWLRVLLRAAPTLTRISISGGGGMNEGGGGISFAPFARLTSLSLTMCSLHGSVLESLVGCVVSGQLPELTSLNLTHTRTSDLSSLDRLVERPIPRPVRIEIEHWSVSLDGSGPEGETLTALTIDLRSNFDIHWHHKAVKPPIPPLVARKFYATQAAEGRLSLKDWPEALVLGDEHLLEMVVEQGAKFPEFVPLVRIPLSLLRLAPRLVRPGRSLNLEVNVTYREKVSPEEVAALRRAVRLAAGKVDVVFRNAGNDRESIMGQLVDPIFSGGSFDPTALPDLGLVACAGWNPSKGFDRPTCDSSLRWGKSQGYFSVCCVPSRCLNNVASALLSGNLDIKTFRLDISSSSRDVDSQAQELLRAMVVLSNDVSIAGDRGTFDPIPVFAAWDGVIKAGAVRRCAAVSMYGRTTVRINDGKAELIGRSMYEGHGCEDLAALGDVIPTLCSTFGVHSVVISGFRARSDTTGQLDARDLGLLRGLGAALCSVTSSVEVVLTSSAVTADTAFAVGPLLDPLIAGGVNTLLGKKKVLFAMYSPSDYYARDRPVFAWENTGDMRSLTVLHPAESKVVEGLDKLALSSFRLHHKDSDNMNSLNPRVLSALLLDVKGRVEVDGVDAPSVVSAWHELVVSGAVPRLKSFNLRGSKVTIDAGGDCAAIDDWGGVNPTVIADLVTILREDFKFSNVKAVLREADEADEAAFAPHLSRLGEALAGAVSLTVSVSVRKSPAQAFGLMMKPLLRDGTDGFLAKSWVSVVVGDARFLWRITSETHRALSVHGLPVGELTRVLDIVKKTKTTVQSFTAHLRGLNDFKKVAGTLSEIVAEANEVDLRCAGLDVYAELVKWRQVVRPLALPGLTKAVVHGDVVLELHNHDWGKVCVTQDSSLTTLSPLVATLCYECGVTNLHLDISEAVHPSEELLARLAGTISGLPLASLTVSGHHSDWAVDVVRPGPGPLRELTFADDGLPSHAARQRLAALLGPNESIVALWFHWRNQEILEVDPNNFRLLSSSTFSQRNKVNREKLASLLSALDINQEIPPEVGVAIRRAQVRE